MTKKSKYCLKYAGFSLVEILVVLAVFSVIGVIVSQSILSTLRGSKRSDSDSKVRENLDYAMAILERHLRNAKTATCTGTNRIDFVDQRDTATYFTYNVVGSNCSTDCFIASGSARVTSSDVKITAASFVCSAGTSAVPTAITITLTGEDALAQGTEKSRITTSSKIILRSLN